MAQALAVDQHTVAVEDHQVGRRGHGQASRSGKVQAYATARLRVAEGAGTDADPPLEEAAEVGRVVEAQLERQLRHRRHQVGQPATGFALQPVVDQVQRAAPGMGAGHAVQPVGAGAQPLGVAPHRPVVEVVGLHQRQEARVQGRLARAAAIGRSAGARVPRRGLGQPPHHRTRQPQGHRAVAVQIPAPGLLLQVVEQPVQALRGFVAAPSRPSVSGAAEQRLQRVGADRRVTLPPARGRPASAHGRRTRVRSGTRAATPGGMATSAGAATWQRVSSSRTSALPRRSHSSWW
jgi:hypothetical protein